MKIGKQPGDIIKVTIQERGNSIGINKTGIIKKGLLVPILLLFFAAFIALITTSILLDGEFGDNPWYSAFGFVVAIVLLLMGLLRIRIVNKSES